LTRLIQASLLKQHRVAASRSDADAPPGRRGPDAREDSLPFDPGARAGDETSPRRAATPASWETSSGPGDESAGEDNSRGDNPLEARGPSWGADENAGGDVQQVSDWMRILSDRPSTGKPHDPGRPPRTRGLADRACGEHLRARDASGLPGARLRMRSISGRTSSSCGVSFSTGEASSGAGLSPPDSER
jgi:hypothetical protein